MAPLSTPAERRIRRPSHIETLARTYVSAGKEISLSGAGQLQLVLGVMSRGAALRMIMLGHSMTPFIRDGDTVTIAPPLGAKATVGEIVAFTTPGAERLTVHRLVGRKAGGWLVKGDHCVQADGVIQDGQILGRVIRVERGERQCRLGISFGVWPIAILSRSGILMWMTRVLVRAKHVIIRASDRDAP